MVKGLSILSSGSLGLGVWGSRLLKCGFGFFGCPCASATPASASAQSPIAGYIPGVCFGIGFVQIHPCCCLRLCGQGELEILVIPILLLAPADSGCPLRADLAYLMRSLYPDENTSWCTGSPGGVTRILHSYECVVVDLEGTRVGLQESTPYDCLCGNSMIP